MLGINELRERAHVVYLVALAAYQPPHAVQIDPSSTAQSLGPEGAPGGLHPFSPLAPSSNGEPA